MEIVFGMRIVFGVILMLIGSFGSFAMCDRDLHPFKDNTDIIRIVDAVFLAIYGVGFYLTSMPI